MRLRNSIRNRRGFRCCSTSIRRRKRIASLAAIGNGCGASADPVLDGAVWDGRGPIRHTVANQWWGAGVTRVKPVLPILLALCPSAFSQDGLQLFHKMQEALGG